MNSFFFPEKIPRSLQTTQSEPCLLAGRHRVNAKPVDEEVHKISQTTIAIEEPSRGDTKLPKVVRRPDLRLLERLELIERSEVDGKVIDSLCYIPIIKKTNKTPKQDKIEQLQEIYTKMTSTMQRGRFNESESLAKAASLLASLKKDEQILITGNDSLFVAKKSRSDYNERDCGRMALLHTIQMAITSLEKEVVHFPFQSQTSDILQLLKLIANTHWGQEFLINDNEVFFNYINAYIFFISQRLSVIYPKNPVLEKQFADIIARIHTLQSCLENSTLSIRELEQILLMVHVFACTVSIELQFAAQQLRKKLSEMIKPKGDILLPMPDLNSESLFMQTLSLDQAKPSDNDVARQAKLKCLSNIMNELIVTESTFCDSISQICFGSFNSVSPDRQMTFFEVLLAEELISLEELQLLSKGWGDLRLSSINLVKLLASDDSKSDPKDILRCCLEAFSPQKIFHHMQNFQTVVVNFVESDKIIKRLQSSEKGARKLNDFKGVARSDIIDILIKPVQRPPRYELLLGELIKTCSASVVRDALKCRQEYIKNWIKAIQLSVDFEKK